MKTTTAYIICNTIIFFILSFQTVYAQSKVYGSIIDINGKPIISANVLLLNSKDSSLVKGTVTDNAGTYYFDKITIGKYFIASTFTGFEKSYTSLLHIISNHDDIDAGTLKLMQNNAELNNVTVYAKRPLYEQKIDRLVINVENSITSAGNTALEVLERSPGVVVDHQNNLISMNGKDGVVLMINGKINHMPVAAVVQMLSGMSAGNIEKIELITTPPANFDAEGNAGYINIVLKANNNFGTNGSFSATLGYGKGLVSEASFNFNHRKGKINFYGDLSCSRIRKPFPASIYTKISNEGNITETYDKNNRVDTTRNFNGRLGLDYQAGKRTVIGVLISGYDNKYSQSETTEDLIFVNKQLDTSSKGANYEINRWSNAGGNVNLQHNFSGEEKLSLNLDYIYYTNDQPVHYSTSYYKGTSDFLHGETKRSGKSTPIHFWIGAADYSKKLGKKINMEAGVKETRATFTNDITLDRFIQDEWIRDASLSAKYKLNENYSAVYTSFNITVNKTTDAKIGFRYEYTNSNLGTQEIKNIVDRHYGKLFPTFYVSHKLSENSSVNFSYSKRITRPTFNDLAPFTYYINANTLLTGNPALQASLTNSVKADYKPIRWPTK